MRLILLCNMYVGHMNHPLVIFKRSSHPKALWERFGLKSKICTPPRDCRGMARLNDVFSLGNSSNLSFFGPWNLVDEPRCEFLSHIILASFKFKDFFFWEGILRATDYSKCKKNMLQINNLYLLRTHYICLIFGSASRIFQKPDFTLGSSRSVTLKQNRKLESRSRCRID